MADWSDISDLWWLQPQRESGRALQGLALGAQMRQQRTQEDWRKEQAQSLIDQRRAAIETQQAKVQGVAKISSYLTDVAKRNAWTDPESRAGLYSLHAQYPQSLEPNELRAIDQNFVNAIESQQKAKDALRTPDITEMERANRDEELANMIEEMGPLEPRMASKVAQLRQNSQFMRSQFTRPGETTRVYGPGGEVVFESIRGGAGAPKDPNAPTQAVLTETQKQSLAGESAVASGVNLINNLTESSVGARGFFNEYVINRGVAQVFPEFQQDEVTSGRTMMRIFNERQKKAIKADAQLNEKEQQRLEDALPKFGPFENLRAAKVKMAAFIEEHKTVERISAARTKRPVREWAWTKEDIAQKFKNREIDEQTARNLLKSYHYNLTPAERAPVN